ncbi:MAG: succinylglutamate desuccinylase/aspartoacylase family protein [Parvibaculaceae bacterium]
MSSSIDIDLDAPGRQTGLVRIDSVSTPIHCLARGDGPTLLLTAGVHGDEYEGQVALAELARDLDIGEVSGRVIILPMANGPACLAGERRTPIDGLNLNRAFPGKADGGFTSRLAHFIETELHARADYAADFHGGGAILHFLPSTLFVVTEDEAANRRRRDLAQAFGARYVMLFGAKTMGVEISIDAGMIRQDVVGISGEFGGSAEITPAALALCRDGVRRLLAHLGIVARPAPPLAAGPAQLIDVRPDDCYLLAESEGLFEPLAQLGDFVRSGAPVARMHRPDRPGDMPTVMHARRDGLVMARRPLAKSSPGDWLLIIGQPV